ncbi:MAG: hypothetical protein ACKOXP_09805 [Flavobacteriales bacterium]
MKTNLLLTIILSSCFYFQMEAQSKNQLSIETGLFHSFLDGGPLMNVDPHKINSNIFLESYSIQYQRKINQSQQVAVKLTSYKNTLLWIDDSELTLFCSNHSFLALSGVFSRAIPISTHLDFTYGGGVDMRFNREQMDSILNVSPYLIYNGYDFQQLQLGTRGQIGISYSPLKWLTLYSQFNASAYLVSKEIGFFADLPNLADFTYQKHQKDPSRFDLSLRFGIGINF